MKPSQKVFHILDLDRTLLDTSKLSQTLKELIAKQDRQLAQLIHDEALRHAQARTSFFIFEYIERKIGEAAFDTLIKDLHKAVPSKNLFMPGAIKRIAYAKSKPGWGMGIMTYGSRRDQMIKLKLLGLHHEHLLITDTPEKAAIIIKWKRPDGTFKLPIDFGGHTVDILTLDDDKYIAFEQLPEGVYGQWITNAALGGTTELPHLSENMRAVSSLTGSIQYLKTKLR